jgi:rSAM/selenodomain-associated transferase 1
MQYPRAKILVFCKAPQAGKVKTRLAKDIGEQAAVSVHKYLAQRCLQQLVASSIAPVELWCSPNTDDAFFVDCQADFGVSLKQQIGNDLGQRMRHAVHETLHCHAPVIVLGTDCPALTADYLRSALFAASQYKTVIGPAEDGGYVLLGVNELQEKLFENMPWGTPKVYDETLSRLTGKREILAPLWDVDYVADLQRLQIAANDLRLGDQFQAYLKTLKLS